MIKRKGKFLTLCFSLVPGAGHMYLGFMKQGISLMFCFWGTLFLATYLNIGALAFLFPIMLCYSLFDAINKNSLSDEDFYALEDTYLFNLDLDELKGILHGKFHPLIALIFIIIGVQLLLSNCYSLILPVLPQALSSLLLNTLRPFLIRLPQILIAIAIIAVGLHLIRGKKTALGLEEKEADTYENP
ncbi:hypothetical protein [Acetivibrio ethanolgignens]|uniref:TM2 domain-containing protein n=1 Tax=Acetivibrio ethanolgignens TaxID=290052 RepID=A0A0V8QFY4_9FIRM|nr:hypothetical protein [Acetivibrio ethanolgignens]KSV59342.1 hypothetical protein ASU35_09285 [Acetivibrio ethanolgignens]